MSVCRFPDSVALRAVRGRISARFEPKQPLSRDRSLPERRSKALPELIEFFELLGPANARSGTAVHYKSVPGYKA